MSCWTNDLCYFREGVFGYGVVSNSSLLSKCIHYCCLLCLRQYCLLNSSSWPHWDIVFFHHTTFLYFDYLFFTYHTLDSSILLDMDLRIPLLCIVLLLYHSILRLIIKLHILPLLHSPAHILDVIVLPTVAIVYMPSCVNPNTLDEHCFFTP